jgi:hypothetical protein
LRCLLRRPAPRVACWRAATCGHSVPLTGWRRQSAVMGCRVARLFQGNVGISPQAHFAPPTVGCDALDPLRPAVWTLDQPQPPTVCVFAHGRGLDRRCAKAVYCVTHFQSPSQSPSTYGMPWGVVKCHDTAKSIDFPILQGKSYIMVHQDIDIRRVNRAAFL